MPIQATKSLDLSDAKAQEFIQAINQALAAGAHTQARQIAAQAVERYPNDPELARMAQILARPMAMRRKHKARDSARSNQLWLQQNYATYQDRWVALRDGELLGVADSVQALKASITDFTNVMVTKV